MRVVLRKSAARRGRVWPFATLLVAPLLLAACVQSPAESNTALLPGEDEAMVLGRVISDEIFPVRDANVTVPDGPTTTTDAEGRFQLGGLAPGRVTISVLAMGYEPLEQSVEIVAGAVVEVTFLLEGIPGQTPYVSTRIFSGYIACGWAIVFGAGWYPFTPCPSGSNVDTFKVEVGPDWAAGVHEMTWKTSEEMLLTSSMVPRCANNGAAGVDPCPAIIAGKHPLKIIARPNDAAYAKKYAIDKKVMWPATNYTSYLLTAYSGYARTEINNTFNPACVVVDNAAGSPPEWGCPFGLGVTTGLRSELYHTTFYLQEPPKLEEYSAIPDQ